MKLNECNRRSKMMRMTIHFIGVLMIGVALSVSAAPTTQPLENYSIDFNTSVDPALQKQVEAIDASLREKLGIKPDETNVGVLDLNTLRLAMIHPDHEEYAASVAKIGILLAYFQLHPEAATSLDPTIAHELGLMAKASNNEMASKFSHELGLKQIQAVLDLPQYHFYDKEHGGGIWVGKHYGKGTERYGSPVGDNSHAATVRQLLRYFLMLEQGKLVSPQASKRMREIFASPDIPHDDIKFVKGLKGRDVQIIRKWGTWENWLHDCAVVTGGGRHYILVALTHTPKGDDYLEALAPAIDDLMRPLPTVKGGPALGKRDANLECVAQFDIAMPAGVAISKSGRIFLSFPRWSSNVVASCMELVGEQLKPVPDLASHQKEAGEQRLVSIQGLAVDSLDRLWMLDAGSARLYCCELQTSHITQRISFSSDVTKTSTYANDVRIDTKRGKGGFAYVSDSAGGGVIVVDLASGESWRRLQHAPSARSDANFIGNVEGEPLVRNGTPMRGNCDGIALSPDGKHLYYTAFSRREIYSVDCDALCDRAMSDAQVESTIKEIAKKSSANDGMLCDAEGRIYTTDYEANAIRRWSPDGGVDQKPETIVQDERLLWPDALWIHAGYLYITCNQLNRTKQEKPFALFRIPIGAHAIEEH